MDDVPFYAIFPICKIELKISSISFVLKRQQNINTEEIFEKKYRGRLKKCDLYYFREEKNPTSIEWKLWISKEMASIENMEYSFDSTRQNNA